MTNNKSNSIREWNVNEAVLYGENDRFIYENYIKPTCENLARKKAKGTYDATKAVKAFYNVANQIAQKYVRDFKDNFGGKRWYDFLNKSERIEVAEILLDNFQEYIEDLASELR